MSALLALPALVAIAAGAELGADLTVRADARSTTLAPEGAPPTTAAGYSLAPQGTVRLDGAGLRATGSYTPRVWTTDAGREPALLDQVAEAQLATRHAEAWNASVGAVATWASTDPLARQNRYILPGQLASTSPARYVSAWAGTRLEARLDERQTVTVSATAFGAEGADEDAREIVPRQRALGLEATDAYQVGPRDTLRIELRGAWVTTRPSGTDVTGEWASAAATWRRRLTPRLDGWLGAGAGFTATDDPTAARRISVLPAAEAGIARAGDVALEVSARVTPFVDPYSGDVRTLVAARLEARAPVAERVTLTATASAGARTDRVSSVAAAEVRVRWQTRPTLSLEASLVGFAQRDQRPELPSFAEAGSTFGLVWTPTAR